MRSGKLLLALPLLIFGIVLIGSLARETRDHRDELDQLRHDLSELAWAMKTPSPFPQAEERIIDLPEDGNTWHTILFLQADWKSRPAERKAHTIWFTEPGLISLREQTHWHVITTDQAEFQKFRPLVDATPCLLIERANGEVIYRESGPQLGKNNDGLRRAIRCEVQRHCPDGRCLPIHPVPGPENEKPLETEIPAILNPEPRKGNPAGTLFVTLAGLAAGTALNWRKNG